MGRVPVKAAHARPGVAGAVALAMLLAVAGTAFGAGATETKGSATRAPVAASKTESSDAGGAAASAEEGAPDPRNLTKVRQGSVLRRNEPLSEYPDLRGDFEKRRDREVIRHYRWLAELDVIAAAAKKAGDMPLHDRVDDVRRKETQRFWTVMQYLRVLAQEKAMRGNR